MFDLDNKLELRKKLKEKYGEEIIYVFSPNLFQDFEDQFTPIGEEVLDEINGKGFFVSRYIAEYNQNVLQPIPYIILVHEKTKNIFVTRRIGGEERLLNKLAFVGGHVNNFDSEKLNIIRAAARRELREEVFYKIGENHELKFHGIIKDQNSKTSEHIGFVFTQSVLNAQVLEKDKLEGLWLSLDEAKEKIDMFESWGQIVIKNFEHWS